MGDSELQTNWTEAERDNVVYPTPSRTPRRFARNEKDQLHLGSDCATYVFVADGQVNSIHYDGKRRQLFYQGHSLTNLTINKALLGYLAAFSAKLRAEPTAEPLLSSFMELLQILGINIAV